MIEKIVILSLAFVAGICSTFFLKNDSALEQIAEKTIEEISGLEVDFSFEEDDEDDEDEEDEDEEDEKE